MSVSHAASPESQLNSGHTPLALDVGYAVMGDGVVGKVGEGVDVQVEIAKVG